MAEATGQPEPTPAPEPTPTPEPEPAPEPAPALEPEPELQPEPEPEQFAGLPDDWKTDAVAYAAGDEDHKDYEKNVERLNKRMVRFPNPGEILKSFINVETAFKKGKDPDPFPEEGTDEQKGVWRKSNDVPEAPLKSEDLKFDSGLVIGEGQVDGINDYLDRAFAKNHSKTRIKEDIELYYEVQDNMIKERHVQDEEDKINSTEELKQTVGNDIGPTVRAAVSLFKGFSKADGEYIDAPKGLYDQILGARLANGIALGNDADILRYLSQVALELDPGITTSPGMGASSLGNVVTEMAEIEKLMKDKKSEYYSGPKTPDGNKTVMEARYLELVEAKMKMEKRSET